MNEVEKEPYLTPEEIAELATGEAARAIFRQNKEHGPEAAFELGMAMVNVIRGCAFDFKHPTPPARDRRE